MIAKTFEENKAFVSALVEAVKERGEGYVYKYRQCVYYLDGSPACLIGVALDRVGHDEQEIIGLQPLTAVEANAASAVSVMKNLGYAEIICVAASEAQDIQDDRGTWGQALEQFLKRLKASEDSMKYLPST